MKLRGYAIAVLSALPALAALAGSTDYHLTRCVSSGDGRFAASFVGPRNEQRRIAIDTSGIEFGGGVKGHARFNQVKELRLSPVLEVVFVRPEHLPVRFGQVSTECRRVLRNAIGELLKIQDGAV